MALVNELKLEIETTPVVNLIGNHSGQEGNTNGWSLFADTNASFTAVSNATGHYLNQYAISASERTASGGILLSVNQMNCVGKDRINYTFKMSTNTTDSVLVQGQGGFYDANGQFMSGSSFSTSLGNITSTDGIKTFTGPGYAVPAGAASFAITFVPTRFNAGTLPRPATATHLISTLKIAAGTAAEVNTLAFSEPTWTDFTPKSLSMDIRRGGDISGVTDDLTPGTLTAVLKDPAVDPADNPLMRPGRKIRVRAKVPNVNFWVEKFNATCVTLDTTYGSSTITTITATDAMSRLSAYKQPLAFGGSLNDRIAKVVAGTGVPYVTSTQTGSGSKDTAIDQDENASALDQLTRTRNAFGGYSWVDSRGYLRVHTAADMPASPYVYFRDSLSSTVAGTFPVDYHTDIDVSFGSKALVNSVLVTRKNRDESEDEGAKTYGPYKNVKSIGQWGEITDSVEINDGNPATLAGAWLATFNDPKIFPNELSFSATKSDNHRNAAISLELFDRARVAYKTKINGDYRIMSIEDSIRPDSWTVTVKFRPLETAASITVTNPPGGSAAGPSDVLSPMPGPLSSRYRSTVLSIPNATFQNIVYDSITSESQITYDSTNRRWIAPRDGRYIVNALVTFTANGTGFRAARVLVNSNIMITSYIPASAGGAFTCPAQCIVALKAGDVINVQGYQNSGGALNITAGAGNNFVDITYVGN